LEENLEIVEEFPTIQRYMDAIDDSFTDLGGSEPTQSEIEIDGPVDGCVGLQVIEDMAESINSED
jgi:hypothetical protein